MQTTFGTLAACAAVTFGVMLLTPNNYQGNPNQPMASAQEDSAPTPERALPTDKRLAALEEHLAQNPVQEQQTNDPDAALRAKLEGQPISVSFDNTLLVECIDDIRNELGINIVVNWPALQLVGIDKNEPISLLLKDVPTQQVLHFMLAQASADCFDDDKAGSQLDNGVLSISTRKDLKSETQVRVYNIRQLLPDAKTAESQQAKQPSRGQTVDLIVETICRFVGTPDEWLDEKSTIIELNGNLIVQTNSSNHEQIFKILHSLDDKAAVQTSRLW